LVIGLGCLEVEPVEKQYTVKRFSGDLTVADFLQPRDHPRRGRLLKAGRADEDRELAVADVERHVLDGFEPSG
jgi:hypothetical protein